MSVQSKQKDPIFETESLKHNLASRARSGALITLGLQFFRIFIQLGYALLMARILLPEDFGLIAMAIAVTSFVIIFSDLGLSTATIQREDADQNITSALFFIGLGIGIALTIVAASIAPVATIIFSDDRLFWLIILMSTSIPFAALAAQPKALLTRRMKWRTVYTIHVIAQFSAGATGVFLATIPKLGYWSLAYASISLVVVECALFWLLCGWRPTWPRRWASSLAAIRLGLHLSGFQLANYVHRQLDNILLGARWGPEVLGEYSRAYLLYNMPLSIVNSPLASVAITTLSRVSSDIERWRSALQKIFCILAIAAGAISSALYIGHYSIVLLVLGDRWTNSAEIFEMLSACTYGAMLANATGWAYISMGRTRSMMWWGVSISTIMAVMFIVTFSFGPLALARGYLLITLFSLPVCIYFCFRGLEIKTIDFHKLYVLPLFAAGISAETSKYLFRGKLADNRIYEDMLLMPINVVLYAFIMLILVFGLPSFLSTKSIYVEAASSMFNAFKKGRIEK